MREEKETVRRGRDCERLEQILDQNFIGTGGQQLCQFQFEKNHSEVPSKEHLQSYMQRLHHHVQGRKERENQGIPECCHASAKRLRLISVRVIRTSPFPHILPWAREKNKTNVRETEAPAGPGEERR